MPNKTIYVPTDDLPLFEEATRLSGEGLSVTIRMALREYIKRHRKRWTMVRLTRDSTWLIQQIDGEVILFQEGTEAEIVRFDPSDANKAAQAQKVIHDAVSLTAEEKCFAHFWSGYFYRCAADRW